MSNTYEVYARANRYRVRLNADGEATMVEARVVRDGREHWRFVCYGGERTSSSVARLAIAAAKREATQHLRIWVCNISDLTEEQVVAAGRAATLPAWATHAAVSHIGRVEPAAWCPKCREYLDEDPATLRDGGWTGAFKHGYWSFVPLAMLQKAAA